MDIKHALGPCSVSNGMLISSYGICTDTPAICFDRNGCLHKYGDVNDVRNWFLTAAPRLQAIHPTIHLELIEFQTYPELTMDDIATIINYGLNSHNNSFAQILLSHNETRIREHIIDWTMWGY